MSRPITHIGGTTCIDIDVANRDTGDTLNVASGAASMIADANGAANDAVSMIVDVNGAANDAVGETADAANMSALDKSV
jgi:hypothetical protein